MKARADGGGGSTTARGQSDLAPGFVLDQRFEIGELINRGGTATIYQAEDLESRGEVALKIPFLQTGSDPHLAAQIESEAELVATLHHPYILKVLKGPEKKSRPYLVMELLNGRPLRAVMNLFRPFPERESLRIASKICEALDYLRCRGVVHRDLKPDNIMMCSDGSIRLLDFGIAATSDAEGHPGAATPSLLGTPDYMAPEQVDGHRVDHRTDLYSLGAILYEMATGRPPFEGDSVFAVMNARIAADPVAPRVLNERLSPQMEELTLHALARNPADRYASAGDMKSELDNLDSVRLTGRHLRLDAPSSTGKLTTVRIRRSVVVALSVFLVQLIGCGLLYWYYASAHAHR